MKTLVVITGPTGIGKTDAAIEVAQHLNTEIISADSRQMYAGMPICTAAPDATQLAAIRHHFIGTLALEDYYSAACFETDALKVINQLFERNDYAVLCGGSMMYIDAVCKGIDEIPTISDDIRQTVFSEYQQHGIEPLREELQRLDPKYYNIVDLNNPKRVIHAIEICRQSGVPYSTLRTGQIKQRPFRIVKIAFEMERAQLFDRINRRVDKMIEQGLEQEARSLYHLRHLNSLNTVGMKEMFAWFDGEMDFITARERIKKNTRVYAKKQMTWFAKDPAIIRTVPTSAAVLKHL